MVCWWRAWFFLVIFFSVEGWIRPPAHKQILVYMGLHGFFIAMPPLFEAPIGGSGGK
jgi:hypothetical protein